MTTVLANDIAVIIVNYNAGAYLNQSLAALHALTQAPGEIIVVDNASEDDSLEQAKRAYPDVHYLEASSNTGFAAANNLGVQATQKAWLALINPDAFVKSDWLSNMLAAINQHQAQFFSSELVDANDHSRLDGQGDCYHVSGLVWRRKHRQKINAENSKYPIFTPCAASAIYARAAFMQVGGFDEDYFCYIEDVDLGFRLRLAGYDCVHVNNAITYHVGSAITQRESDFSIYHGHRNLVWTYFKNMPKSLLWRYLPQHILMNIISLAYYTAKGRPTVIFKAKWHALKGLAKMIKKRNLSENQNKVNQYMTKGWLTPYFGRNK